MADPRISRTFLILFTAVAVSCTDSSVPERRLVETYADVIVARQQYGDSVRVRQAVDSIMAQRQYDHDEFDRDLRSMSATPQLFKAFYDSVSFELKRRRDSLQP